MRLIDADEFKKLLLKERDAIPKLIFGRYDFGVSRRNHDGGLIRAGIRKALRCMEQTPTIEAGPVRHGRWEFHKDGSGTCNQCHFTQKHIYDDDGWQNYCGVCGAEMDGGAE